MERSPARLAVRPDQARWSSSRVRGLGLLGAGSLLVHELTSAAGRFQHGPERSSAHGYLPLAAALVCLLLVVAGCLFVRDLVRARRGAPVKGPSLSFRQAWVVASCWLAVVYVVQETVEGYVSAESDFAAVAAGHRGIAFGCAILVGALIALLLRSARRVLQLAARMQRPALRSDVGGPTRPWQADRPTLVALAWHLAGRGPPLLAR